MTFRPLIKTEPGYLWHANPIVTPTQIIELAAMLGWWRGSLNDADALAAADAYLDARAFRWGPYGDEARADERRAAGTSLSD